jgi:DNA-binding beta-propeller fold protein YncE
MKILLNSLFVVATTLIAACTAPIARSALPTDSAIDPTVRARHATSAESLIYVSTPKNFIYALDYKTGALVVRFRTPVLATYAMCADSGGDIYVLGAESAGNGNIMRFSHGATTPSENIAEYDLRPKACSVDPTTGNLAVLNSNAAEVSEISIYPSGSGAPTEYTVSNTSSVPMSCSYDDQGNLFVALNSLPGGYKLFLLLAEAESFKKISVSKAIEMRALIWESSYLAVAYKKGLYHLNISGKNAVIAGRTVAKNSEPIPWIQNSDLLLEPYGRGGKRLGFWNYPRGGKAAMVINQVDRQFRDINSIVVSLGSVH